MWVWDPFVGPLTSWIFFWMFGPLVAHMAHRSIFKISGPKIRSNVSWRFLIWCHMDLHGEKKVASFCVFLFLFFDGKALEAAFPSATYLSAAKTSALSAAKTSALSVAKALA